MRRHQLMPYQFGRPRDIVSRLFDMNILDLDTLFSPTKEFEWKERMGHCDMYEEDSSYVIKTDVPGLSEDEINITLEDNMITISGERKKQSDAEESSETKPVKKDDMIVSERSYRRFERHLTIPKDVDVDKISAKLDKGVLEIKLEKIPEDVRVKRITITK